ncbi:uncharacterized protein LOC100712513 isoform X4 [Oreochromis niloticus]|uniref:uncharacterized protein LOC100712513 isoform X4 n=1 Tax=Oreochromis niloticus TaxID=8128 RepID=UPI000DF395BA|nr:uncharacterized protein LOC100712513 isoform X4 [Oreochromis niloticus]XP_025761106.1 uncharacterized protein LOC100712513 isoform X4 [Oreochromis niloticus]
MFTLLTSTSWPPGRIHKSTCCVACRTTLGPRTSCFFQLGAGRQVKLTIICSVRVAAIIDSGSWMEKTVLEFFPQQLNGNCRGIFMLMYALCISTSCPLSFTELPACVLIDILEEVVLNEGDTAIFKLALVCSMFRDLVSTEYFRRRAHFKWLHSVCTWSSFSEKYIEQYCNMYMIEICLQCGDQYKHCPRDIQHCIILYCCHYKQ